MSLVHLSGQNFPTESFMALGWGTASPEIPPHPRAMNRAATPLSRSVNVTPMGDRVECRCIEHVVAPTRTASLRPKKSARLFSFFGPRPQTGQTLSVSRLHAASAPALPRSSRIDASAPPRLTSRLRSRTALPAAPPPQSSTTALNDAVHGLKSWRTASASGRCATRFSP